MASQKMTPEQAAAKQYRQTRRYYDTITERAIVHGLMSWTKSIDALTERRKTKPAPFAAAVDAARLQAIRDALAACRVATGTTVTTVDTITRAIGVDGPELAAPADSAALAITAPEWARYYLNILGEKYPELEASVTEGGAVTFRGPTGTDVVVSSGPGGEFIAITKVGGPISDDMRAVILTGALMAASSARRPA